MDEKTPPAQEQASTASPAAGPAAPAAEAKQASPSMWAKAKGTPAWVLAGAYHSRRWVRDAEGNDLSNCTEDDFDAACAAVASISMHSAGVPKTPRKG